MTTLRTTRTTTWLAMLAMLLGLFLGSANAHADPLTSTDQQYLTALMNAGLPSAYFADSGQVTVSLGRQIASTLRQDPTLATLDFIVDVGIRNGIPAYHAGLITGAAIVFYAPELAPLALQWAKSRTNTPTYLR